MKRLLKCFSLAAAVLVLFAGCNQLGVSDATVDGLGATSSVKDGYCALAISTDGLTVSSAKYASRNINPTTLEGTGNTIIKKYVIKGESSTGAKLGENGIGFVLGGTDAPESGTSYTVGEGADAKSYPQYEVTIPYGSWELTLFAYDADNNLLLKGKSFVELKTSKNNVHFTLKTDGVTTEGEVNLAGTFTDRDGVAKTYKAGLYNNRTGLLIPGTEIKAVVSNNSFTFAPTTTTTTTDPDNPDATPTTTTTPKKLGPGRYSFKIYFYNVATTAEITDSLQPVGYYEDLVVVAPGRKTEDTSISCGKIINQLPVSPTNLRAYRVNGSEDADGYTVTLVWEDNSKNEENFVIYLDEYASDAADAAVTKTFVLGTETVAETTDENGKKVEKQNFFTSNFNAGGSVNASSTTASLKLEFGKVYDVSIRAENFVGESIFRKANPSENVTEIEACARVTSAAALTGATQYTSARINRFVIEYDLYGGELTLSETAKTSDNQFDYASIYDYENESAKLLVVAIDPTANPDNPAPAQVLDRVTDPTKLVKNGNPFVNWVKENGASIGTNDKITYEGIKVRAEYNPAILISSEIDDTYKTVSASAKYDDVALVNGVVPVDVTAVKKLTIVATASDPDKIDSVKITVKGQKNLPTVNERYTTAAAEVTYDIDEATIIDMPSGIYTVVVEVHLKDENNSKTYKVSFPIDIQK